MTTPPPAIPEPTAKDRKNYENIVADYANLPGYHGDETNYPGSVLRVAHAALLDVERLRAEVANYQRCQAADRDELGKRFIAISDLRAKCAALERAADEVLNYFGEHPPRWHRAHKLVALLTAAKALAPGDTGGEGRTT